jgi:hypothetical protein
MRIMPSFSSPARRLNLIFQAVLQQAIIKFQAHFALFRSGSLSISLSLFGGKMGGHNSCSKRLSLGVI